MEAISALIAGGASIFSGAMNASTSAQNTQAQIAAQQGFLNQTEAYNTQMSNTAYQRASADMKAAGLNPMMMFGSGGPASSPTMSAPTPPLSQKTSPYSGVGDAVQKSVGTAIQVETAKKLTEEIANAHSENARIAADIDLLRARGSESTASTRLIDAETRIKDLEKTIKQTGGVPEAAAIGARSKLEQEVYENPVTSRVVQSGIVGSSAQKAISPVTDLAGGVVSSALRKQGLDQLRDQMNRSRHSTEHYDVRPGGYTRSKEEWTQ